MLPTRLAAFCVLHLGRAGCWTRGAGAPIPAARGRRGGDPTRSRDETRRDASGVTWPWSVTVLDTVVALMGRRGGACVVLRMFKSSATWYEPLEHSITQRCARRSLGGIGAPEVTNTRDRTRRARGTRDRRHVDRWWCVPELRGAPRAATRRPHPTRYTRHVTRRAVVVEVAGACSSACARHAAATVAFVCDALGLDAGVLAAAVRARAPRWSSHGTEHRSSLFQFPSVKAPRYRDAPAGARKTAGSDRQRGISHEREWRSGLYREAQAAAQRRCFVSRECFHPARKCSARYGFASRSRHWPG